MTLGLLTLALAYILSQFFRAFLAVLAIPLAEDIHASPEAFATASGLWFLGFALMQLPVGAALDRIGPRRTAGVLLALGGGGGAILFAQATLPWHINLAMFLIGTGCAPVLMASYYIFARQFPARQFATLAATMIGVGTLGNLLSAYPMTAAVAAIGWRSVMMVLAVASITVSLAVLVWVKDPLPVLSKAHGSALDLLRLPALWAIFPLMFVNYAPVGAIRGLWIGPYLSEVFALSAAQVGTATLIMGVSMILGTLVYGPMDRLFGTRKWVIFTGNLICAFTTLTLALFAPQSASLSIALLALIGVSGASFPVIIAHARSFFPAHLTGRGVTLINLFGIGGVGIMQFASGRLHTATSSAGTSLPYALIFAFFGGALFLGCLIYLFSRDNMD